MGARVPNLRLVLQKLDAWLCVHKLLRAAELAVHLPLSFFGQFTAQQEAHRDRTPFESSQ